MQAAPLMGAVKKGLQNMTGGVSMRCSRLLALALAFCLLWGLTACAKTGGGPAEQPAMEAEEHTLTIWAWDDTFNVKAANLAKAYYAKTDPGVQVDIVTMAQTDIITRLNTAFSSSNYEGLPNIVLIEDYRIQNFLKSYPGEFQDLSSIVDPNKFMEYKLRVMTEEGKIYGVPFDSGAAALFYRTDYLQAAGYTQEDMQNLTWNEYIEIGKDVKAATGKYMLTLDPSDLGQVRIMMQSAGAWYVKEDGESVDIAENEVLKASLSTYQRMVDSGIALQVSGWDPFVKAFQEGEVASVPSGCWVMSNIVKAEEQSGKWAVAPIPRLDGIPESVNASSIGGGSWYVLSNVPGADLAVDFLGKTFASNEQLIDDLVKDISLVSTMKSAKDLKYRSEPSEFFGGQRIYEDLAAWTEQIPPVNYGLYTYTMEDIIAQSLQSIMQGADMDETLKNAQTQARASVLHS